MEYDKKDMMDKKMFNDTIFKKCKAVQISNSGLKLKLDLNKYLVSSKPLKADRERTKVGIFKERPAIISKLKITSEVILPTSPRDSPLMSPRFTSKPPGNSAHSSSSKGDSKIIEIDRANDTPISSKRDKVVNPKEASGVPRYLTPTRKPLEREPLDRPQEHRDPPRPRPVDSRHLAAATVVHCQESTGQWRDNYQSCNIGDMISQQREKREILRNKTQTYDAEFHELMSTYKNLKARYAQMNLLQQGYDVLMKKFEVSELARKKQEQEIAKLELKARKMLIDRC